MPLVEEIVELFWKAYRGRGPVSEEVKAKPARKIGGRMTTVAEFYKIDGEHVAKSLNEVREKIGADDGEVVLDFSAVLRIDTGALQAIEELAAAAESKSVKVRISRGQCCRVQSAKAGAADVTSFHSQTRGSFISAIEPGLELNHRRAGWSEEELAVARRSVSAVLVGLLPSFRKSLRVLPGDERPYAAAKSCAKSRCGDTLPVRALRRRARSVSATWLPNKLFRRVLRLIDQLAERFQVCVGRARQKPAG